MQQGKLQQVFTILGHVTGWLLFFSLILSFLSIGNPGNNKAFSIIASGPFLIFSAAYLFLFYFNFLLLVPQFFLKKKYWIYFSIILLLFIGFYTLKPFDRLISMNPPPGMPQRTDSRPPPPDREMRNHRNNIDINTVIIFIITLSLSTAIPAIRSMRKTEQKALQAERDKLDAELSFLKAQVNPHFLFNTLNNIYSMAVTKNENTAPGIMKLSNIMRYITDEAGQNFVPLEDEINCMHDYIDLQRMRLVSKMKIEVSVTGNIIGKQIPPLLLMTFVENVFKYGISSHEASTIVIKLSVNEHNINFFTQNKLFEQPGVVERTGIGISNARKRLQRLYPNKHFLSIGTDKGLFTVHLVLQS